MTIPLEVHLALEILRSNPGLPRGTAQGYAVSAIEVADLHQVDPWLVHAVVHVESRWTAHALRREANGTCSIGLAQINVSCESKRVQQLKDPRENLRRLGEVLDGLRARCTRNCHGIQWVAGYNPGSRVFVPTVTAIVQKCHDAYAFRDICPLVHVPWLPGDENDRTSIQCGTPARRSRAG